MANISLAFAQIENKEIVIYGDREISLPVVDRNFEKINFDVPRENFPPQKYNIVKGELPAIADLNSKIKILPVKDFIQDKLYPYFAKVGFGNYASPYLELSAANKRNNKFMYVAHYKHNSSMRGPVLKSFSGVSNNELELTSKYYTKNYTILADADYKRRMNKFYGFDIQNESKDKDTIKQVYHEPNVKLGFNYQSKDSLFDITTLAKYEGLFTKKNSHEHDLGYTLQGAYNLKKLKVPSIVHLNSELSVINKFDLNTQQRYLFAFVPTYEYEYRKFTFEGGFNLSSENDTSSFSKAVHFYPILKVYTMPLKGLGLKAEISGGLQKNTLKSVSYENPFIYKGVNIYHTNEKLKLAFDVEASLIKNLFFNLGVNYKRLNNLPFYINSGIDSSRFNIVYDSTGKTNFTQLKAGLIYEFKTYSNSLQVEKNIYKLGDGSVAIHKPTFILKNSHSFNYRKKVYFEASFWYLDGIKTYQSEFNTTVVKLKPIIDLSVGLKYKLNNRIGLFLDVNNLLAQKYQRYLYYKNQSINFMIGAYASF